MNDETFGAAEPRQVQPSAFLEPQEFCHLLLARKRLVRNDKAGSSVRSLVDEANGAIVQIDEASLAGFLDRAERSGNIVSLGKAGTGERHSPRREAVSSESSKRLA